MLKKVKILGFVLFMRQLFSLPFFAIAGGALRVANFVSGMRYYCVTPDDLNRAGRRGFIKNNSKSN